MRYRDYFWAGAGVVGFCAGAGADLVWLLFTFDRTDLEAGRRSTKIDNVIEVTMKITADQVVALDSALAAPRGPKAVWLPMPPKAAEMSPAFPLCSSTTMMMKKQTMM